MKKLALFMIVGAMMFAFSGIQKANAVVIGQPGEALLVPYVLYSSVDSINTLVGITTPSQIGLTSNPILRPAVAGGVDYATTLNAPFFPPIANGGLNAIRAPRWGSIHWFFFDARSNHILDNVIPATRDDYVPFDWGAVVRDAGAQLLCDGVPGYLVFSNVIATNGGPATFTMFGDAALVAGNWQSAAYIPVMPMGDGADTPRLIAGLNEVNYTAGIPSNVSPLATGIPMDNDNGIPNNWDPVPIAGQHIDMRYFLDPALNGGTDLVVWFDRRCPGPPQCCDRTALPIEVFATDETHGSAVIDLSLELNVVDASLIPWTSHIDTDMNGGPLTNEGFVWFTIPELPGITFGPPVVVCGNADVKAADGPDSAAVAFSLIYFGTSANDRQVQTALAHERGLW